MGKVSYEDDNVVRIAKEGVDISTNISEDILLHSGFTYEMVDEDMEGYIDYTSPSHLDSGTEYTVGTVVHNFGYVPEFHVFMEDSDANTYAELPRFDLSVGGLGYRVKINDTTMTIVLVSGSSSWDDLYTDKDYRFRYQIFVNQLNSA